MQSKKDTVNRVLARAAIVQGDRIVPWPVRPAGASGCSCGQNPRDTVSGIIRHTRVRSPWGSIAGVAALAAVAGVAMAGEPCAPEWDNTIGKFPGGFNATVSVLMEHDGQLFAGGGYISAGGSPARRIARWDGASWHALGDGMNHSVRALAVYDGEVIAAGNFLFASGAEVSGIARWDEETELWYPLGRACPGPQPGSCCQAAMPGETGCNDPVCEAAVCDCDAYCCETHWDAFCGYFGIGCGAMASCPELCPGLVGDACGMHNQPGSESVQIDALAVYDGDLIAGGTFTIADGVTVNRIARWDGSSWHPLGSGTNSWVQALIVYDGDLIASGTFTSAGGVSANRIARWDGENWHPLGSGFTASAGSLAVYDGDLIAGGLFTTAGGVPANRIARWDGEQWHAMGGGVASDEGPQSVNTLLAYGGDLIVGGHFITADGVQVNHIARWDGAALHPMSNACPGSVQDGCGMNSTVWSLAEYNGELIVGGTFSPQSTIGGPPSAFGTDADRVIAWDGCVETEAGVPGDLDGNGVVNVFDLLMLLAEWGACPEAPAPEPGQCSGICGGQGASLCMCDATCAQFGDCCPGACFDCPGLFFCDCPGALCPPPLTPPCPADLTGSGAVDVFDLLELLANWG